MPEDEIVEETTTEVIETTEEDIEVSSEPDILDDVPGTEEGSKDDPENIEGSSEETVEESIEETVEETTEELSEDMTEELTEELLEEMTEESTEYILYMTEQETEVPFLEKSFTEYSTTEGLLLLIFIILFVWFIRSILFD